LIELKLSGPGLRQKSESFDPNYTDVVCSSFNPFLILRHCMPLRLSIKVAEAQKVPLHRPNPVKYHSRPAESSKGCKIAAPVAAMAHRVTLVAAAAVLGLSGKMSTIRTP
jgi:hypothetical protein